MHNTNRFGHTVTTGNNADGEATVTVTGQCVLSGRDYTASVSALDYALWRNGTNIDKAMTETTAADREWFAKGICPSGWQSVRDELPQPVSQGTNRGVQKKFVHPTFTHSMFG